MASEAYLKLLRDPRWQRKRLEILQRDDFQCQLCADRKSTLHVHHKKYIFGRKPWEYDEEILMTLCESCHEEITEAKKDLAAALDRLDQGQHETVLGFVEALLAGREQPEITVRGYGHAFGVASVIQGAIADYSGGLGSYELYALAQETQGKIEPYKVGESVRLGTWKRRLV